MRVAVGSILLGAWLAIISLCAYAGEFERGADAYLKGEYSEALNIWRPLAAEGDVVAMFNVAVLLAEGLGGKRDPVMAARWYHIAGARGYAPAQFNLGVAYKSGVGVQQSDADAAEWWHKAAEQGHSRAQYELGGAYLSGQGVPKDLAQAKRWYELARETGDPRAVEALAKLGEVSANSQPSRSVSAPSEEAISIKHEPWIRDQVPNAFTIQLFTSTEQEAAVDFIKTNRIASVAAYFQSTDAGRPWYKVVYGNYPDVDSAKTAQAELPDLLTQHNPWVRTFSSVLAELDAAKTASTNMDSVPSQAQAPPDNSQLVQEAQVAFNREDYQQALEIWRPLAEKGVADAQYGLGFLYESGWGVERNLGEAFNWYQLAAQQGHAKSQYNLGVLYFNGEGVEQNDGFGVYWIQNAADRKDIRAIEFLAKMRQQKAKTSTMPGELSR